MNGALVNVDQAYKRGKALECTGCGQKGATVNCFKQRCGAVYHVACAQKHGVMFYQDKVRGGSSGWRLLIKAQLISHWSCVIYICDIEMACSILCDIRKQSDLSITVCIFLLYSEC